MLFSENDGWMSENCTKYTTYGFFFWTNRAQMAHFPLQINGHVYKFVQGQTRFCSSARLRVCGSVRRNAIAPNLPTMRFCSSDRLRTRGSGRRNAIAPNLPQLIAWPRRRRRRTYNSFASAAADSSSTCWCRLCPAASMVTMAGKSLTSKDQIASGEPNSSMK